MAGIGKPQRRPTQPQDGAMWSKRQAAVFLAVSISTIDRLIASGELPAFQVGKRGSTIRLNPDDVHNLLHPIPTV